ncbi:protein takeout-like [Bacillus rossius redtenbacheri]|uniref:protein takeout-like n=1 Tax=Bacillus rossius redtenbacheri TaxID=93214 RepID=UPI002FDE89D8
MALLAASLTALLALVAGAAASIAAHDVAPRKNNEVTLKCKLGDSDCIKDFLQNDLIGKFSQGFPDYGVKSLDPLEYGEISFKYEVGAGTNMIVTHKAPILYGMGQTKVIDVTSTLSGSKYSMQAHVLTPKYLYEGSYTCVGEWMQLPFSWKGKFNISLGDVYDTWTVKANLLTKGDESHLHLEEVTFDPKVTTFKAYASGLFGDMEEVGKFALEMTNKYWKNFFHVMWRNAEPAVIGKTVDEIQGIFANTPIKRMFYL